MTWIQTSTTRVHLWCLYSWGCPGEFQRMTVPARVHIRSLSSVELHYPELSSVELRIAVSQAILVK